MSDMPADAVIDPATSPGALLETPGGLLWVLFFGFLRFFTG
jgi:hypothetical protein